MDLSKYFKKSKDETVTESTNETKVDERFKGKIIKVDLNKGFGFITSHDIPFTRIFFHWTSLIQNTKKMTELTKNMEVEFTPQVIKDNETGQDKVRAIKIRVI